MSNQSEIIVLNKNAVPVKRFSPRNGFEFTGDFRVPKEGDYYYDPFIPNATFQAGALSLAPRFILRKLSSAAEQRAERLAKLFRESFQFTLQGFVDEAERIFAEERDK